MTDVKKQERGFVGLWVFATTAGWIAGLFVLIAFVAIAERIGLSGFSGVGLGISLCSGIAQWLVARSWFAATSQWIWATAFGVAAPFVFVDLLETFGVRVPEGELIIAVCVASGGLLTGVWQSQLLKSRTPAPRRWIILSFAAWTLAALTTLGIMKGGHPETAIEMVRNLGAIPIGGLVLGLVSGRSLAMLLRPDATPE